MGSADKLTNIDVIAAIRTNHLKANIDHFEREPEKLGRPNWSKAFVDPGGSIFGPGPYLKVPIVGGEWGGTTQRVYAPARLRRRLAERWIYVKPKYTCRQCLSTKRGLHAPKCPNRRRQ
jgi:hypothetical protein